MLAVITMRIAAANPLDAFARAAARHATTAAEPAPKAPATKVDRYQPSETTPPSLLERLAPSASRGETQNGSPMDPAAKVGALLETMFGIKVADLAMNRLETSTTRALSSQEQWQVDGPALDYAGSFRAYEDVRLAAEGTVTTADGQTFAFTLDYQRQTTVAVEQRARVMDTARPTEDGPKPPLPWERSAADPLTRLKRLLDLVTGPGTGTGFSATA